MKAAKNGHVNSMFSLGNLYKRRVNNLKEESFNKELKIEEKLSLLRKSRLNKSKAEEWYLKAIENGNVEAKYNLGDKVVMKKDHACGTNLWLITRVGVDIKLKCVNCNHEIMMDRLEFEKKLRRVLHED